MMTRRFALVALLVTPLAAQNFQAAAAYSKNNDGCAVVVYHAGKLVFEEYQNGYKAEKPHHIYSGTKSFAPAVALIAQDEGLLKLDEKVSKTITEWQADDQKQDITIRQLLNFTSGLRNIDSTLHKGGKDTYKLSIEGSARHDPGTRFNYGSSHLMVFGEVMRRKLATHADAALKGKDVLAYLKKKVLDPIGLKTGRWIRDAKRNPALPYGAYLTAREWAKYGLLILNRGKHGKQQVIPTKCFDECFQGSKALPVYGLNWWLVGKRAGGVKHVPADTIGALGMYRQGLFVIPSKKMVIVRYGKYPARTSFKDVQFLSRLFTPKTKGEKPAKEAKQKVGNR